MKEKNFTFDSGKAKDYFLKEISFKTNSHELNQKIKDCIEDLNIIDVRSYDDYIEGHIPFAIHVPLDSLEEHSMMFEKDKLNYSAFEEILDLERLKYLKGNIFNLFFNNRIYIKASEIDCILSNTNLAKQALRIIYSYADDKYGTALYLLMDKVGQQSGKKQLFYLNGDDRSTAYYHKLFFDTNAEFGDMILTAIGSEQYAEISRCVKQFAKDLRAIIDTKRSTSVQDVISESIRDLYRERMTDCNFSDNQNIKWYIVIYEEFFYYNSLGTSYNSLGTSLSVLRRIDYSHRTAEEDNIYDIQCLAVNDNDFYNEHYHPFYLALCHKLTNNVLIEESSLKYTGVHIEYAHPCVLSNGWKIRINEKGNWIIDFNGNPLDRSVNDLAIDETSGIGEYDCCGCDSISKMADFINSL